MNAQEVRAFVERAQSAWNRHDRAAYTGDYAEDVVISGPGGTNLRGRAGAELFYDMWQAAFPDTRVEIDNVIVDQDSACVEARFVGTQSGTLRSPMGEIAPTGKRVSIPFAHLFTLGADAKVKTTRLYFDTAEMMTQLGLMPAPATA